MEDVERVLQKMDEIISLLKKTNDRLVEIEKGIDALLSAPQE